jgi:hypothetical protein
MKKVGEIEGLINSVSDTTGGSQVTIRAISVISCIIFGVAHPEQLSKSGHL